VALRKLWLFSERVLTHPRLPLRLALLAALLALPSLGAGLLVDDYNHKLLVQHPESPEGLGSAPWDMFRWFDGNPQQIGALVDLGVLPWWTQVNLKGLKGAFWRPIASITHWFDYRFWPQTPALMHAQSIAWYALLVAVCAIFYRRTMGFGVAAGLAALLYGIDSVHATPIVFLANRNALIAGVFGVLCLMAHERWRRAGWHAGAVMGPLVLALALLAKEEAIATCAYLAAFAAFLDDAPWRRRVASLVPYGLVVIVWRAAWLHLGYGVAHISFYIDPLQEPVRFAVALVRRSPMLLLSQLTSVPAELSFIPQGAQRVWLVLAAWLILAGIGVLVRPMVRLQRVAKFWLTGMLLSLVPASTVWPSDRMLLFIGLGAMGLIAELVVAVFSRAWPAGRVGRTAAYALAGVLLVVHVAVAPLALAGRTAVLMVVRPYLESFYLHEPLDRAIEREDLVLVNPPSGFATLIPPFIWASEGAPMPRHMRVLCSSNLFPVEVERTDERTLVVRPATGYLATELDGPQCVFTVGQHVHLTGMDAEITAVTPDGRPLDVAFRFAVPLEDDSLRWMQWSRGEFQRFTPPPVGKSIILPANWRDAFSSPDRGKSTSHPRSAPSENEGKARG
jgi:hypothetical protein